MLITNAVDVSRWCGGQRCLHPFDDSHGAISIILIKNLSQYCNLFEIAYVARNHIFLPHQTGTKAPTRMFRFTDAAQLLSSEPPNKPRVIDNIALQELKSSGVRPGIFLVETLINVSDWRAKRDAIMNDPIWSNGGMKPYLFPMTAGNNSQTMLLPTACSLLDLTQLTEVQKEEAYLHETQFANGPAIISMGNILHDLQGSFAPTILFGRSWHKNVPSQPNFGTGAMDNASCSAIHIGDDGAPHYSTTQRNLFHLYAHVHGSPKKYFTTCYSLSYKQTGGVTTGKVVATFPAIIFNLNIIDRDQVRAAINAAYVNHSFN